jgi:hypothetical protein
MSRAAVGPRVIDTAIFARHLDLRPLGRRQRGLVRCRLHDDRSASLSLDLERGLFNCFGCGTQGGLRDFVELVGERAPARPPRVARPRSDSETALERVLAADRAAAARRAEWLPIWFVCDHLVLPGDALTQSARRLRPHCSCDDPSALPRRSFLFRGQVRDPASS